MSPPIQPSASGTGRPSADIAKLHRRIAAALKDTMRAGPGTKRRTAALVKEMRRAGISSRITLYAIRDLKGAEREAILRVKATR